MDYDDDIEALFAQLDDVDPFKQLQGDRSFGQPIPGLKIFHDIIDARKDREIKRSIGSFLYHTKKTQAPGSIVVNDTDYGEKVKQSLFMYLYRHDDPPKFFPPEDEEDAVAETIAKLVHLSPHLKPQKGLSKHNKWLADYLAASILSGIQDMADAISEAAKQALKEALEDADKEAEGQGEEESENDNSDSEDSKENEGKPSTKGAAGASRDGDGLTERFNEFAEKLQADIEYSVDGDTSVQEMMEQIDPEHHDDDVRNPLADSDRIIDMARIADKMGRMRSTMTAMQANKIMYAPGAVVDLTTGRDVRMMCSTEAVHLGEETEAIFDMKWKDHGLLQRKTEGVDQGGRGPVMFCIDVSGSMSQWDVEWAMALGGALGFAAAKRGRDVAFVFYSNTVPEVIWLDYKQRRTGEDLESSIRSCMDVGILNDTKTHKHSALEMMGRKKVPNGGGTCYAEALKACRDLYKVNRRWEYADIVFLSDGGDAGGYGEERAEDVAKWLNSKGVRIFGIGLVAPGREQESVKTFEQSMSYMDRVVIAGVDSSTDADDVVELIGKGL